MSMFLDFFNRVVNSRLKTKKVLTFPIKSLTGELIDEEATLTLSTNEDTTTDNYIIYRAYISQRTNERQGTVNTLTRAEVRGGGRKPWRQKGTGRARAGSNRSPLWKGGGVSFGPKPKQYFNKLNRKEWKLAVRSLLITRAPMITVINSLENNIDCRTSNFINLFKNCNINFSQKTIIILPKVEDNLFKATRNIKTISLMRADTLNLVKILRSRQLIISKDSLKIIEETYDG